MDANNDGEQSLSKLWSAVRINLEALSGCLRNLEGCEHVVITLLLCNGERMDSYTVPVTACMFGSNTASMNIDSIHGHAVALHGEKEDFLNRVSNPFVSEKKDVELLNTNKHSENTELGSNEAICVDEENRLQSFSLDVLDSLTTKELRQFFSRVRKKLNLNRFLWPVPAQQHYQKVTRDPVPSGPGRAGSGKKGLIMMLKLSIQCDEDWNKCVNEEIRGLEEKLTGGSNPTVPSNIVVDTNSRYFKSPDRDSRKLLTSQLIAELTANDSMNEEEPLDNLNVIGSVSLQKPLTIAECMPRDNMIASPRYEWKSLSSLLKLLSYPSTNCPTGWYVQATPADGNCLFSAVLTSAHCRGVFPEQAKSVASLRKLLQSSLQQLVRSGRKGSPFRRDWIASSLYDLDDEAFEAICGCAINKALQTCCEDDIETFLAPLRVYVSNWSKKVGCSHWGGLLRVELFILASITASVIEVLDVVDDLVGSTSSDAIQMCDTRQNNRIVFAKRRDIIFPVGSSLPSPNEKFLGPTNSEDTTQGWVGPYPVLRLVLSTRHYSACTSRYTYPIGREQNSRRLSPMDSWFQFSNTLTEPYASLNTEEKKYYEKSKVLFRDWEEARGVSEEQGQHADTVVLQSNSTEVLVSSLSRLQVPPRDVNTYLDYMLNDEIVTCYMHLLQRRNDILVEEARSKGASEPPKSRYMDTWFYKALSRGLSGPSARRKRPDLNKYNMIIFPALEERNWDLAVCYIKEGVIGVYDPLHSPRHDVFEVVRNWAQAQLSSHSRNEWHFIELKESRGCVQKGNIDCGVYICKAAESLGLGYPIRISQWDIHYVRKRMIVEFMKQEATKISWRGASCYEDVLRNRAS